MTSVAESTFDGCATLSKITLPDSVRSTEARAFRGCARLTEVTLSEGVTAIADSAFYGCASLASITLPLSVTSIGANAFAGCKALKAVNCQSSTPPAIADDCFDANTLATITLRVPKDALKAYKQAQGWKDFKKIEAP